MFKGTMTFLERETYAHNLEILILIAGINVQCLVVFRAFILFNQTDMLCNLLMNTHLYQNFVFSFLIAPFQCNWFPL